MVRYSKTAWPGVAGDSTTAPAGVTVNDAIDDFVEELDDGDARDRRGHPLDSRTSSDLRWSLRGHVAERLGALPLSDVHRRNVEALIDELASAGLSRRRLRVVARSVRALYDNAMERGEADHNPAERVALPDEVEEPDPPSRSWPNVDRVVSLALQVATLGFVLLSLFFIAESL